MRIACIRVAPRSWAAVSNSLPMLTSRELTITRMNEIEKVTWPSSSAVRPSGDAV